ncbi:MAG: hypothetical protein Q9221_006362 [Calogaya cf. arnoldii]
MADKRELKAKEEKKAIEDRNKELQEQLKQQQEQLAKLQAQMIAQEKNNHLSSTTFNFLDTELDVIMAMELNIVDASMQVDPRLMSTASSTARLQD